MSYETVTFEVKDRRRDHDLNRPKQSKLLQPDDV